MKILVCTAMRLEHRAVSLGIKQSGEHSEFEVFFTGVGPSKARKALSRRLLLLPKPDLIISTGLAGAMSDGVPIYSWVAAKSIWLDNASQLKQVRVTNLKTDWSGASPVNIISSSFTEFPGPETEAKYSSIPSPRVVDMESATLASLAEDHRIPFMVLRMISDTPQEPPPKFTESWALAMTSPKFFNAVRFSLKGIKDTILNPIDCVRVMINSRRCAYALQKGWRTQAPRLLHETGKTIQQIS